MVDLASHPSRRTVVKAGLWAAPAFAVVNLTAMSAAHASAPPPCITTYPSHGFLIFSSTKLGDNAYYYFKFGNGSSTSPTVSADSNSLDLAALSLIYPLTTIVTGAGDGTTAQQTTWTILKGAIGLDVFSSGANAGYVYTGLTTPVGSSPAGVLVAAYTFDGSTVRSGPKVSPSIDADGRITPATSAEGGQIRFTKCVS